MMMDLLARFHSELRSNAELRATLGAMPQTVDEMHQPSFPPPEELGQPLPPQTSVTAAHKRAAAEAFRNAPRPDYGVKPRQRALPPSRPQARQALMGRGTPS